MDLTKEYNRRFISLRSVRVHNLKSIDLDLPCNKLIAFCGLSGSGKSSLAIDTLYAEGQRRYIESFSAYTRQFLEKLEKPEMERIEGIPPAIAVTSRPASQMSRSTVGTVTETSDYLRLLFAKIGTLYCQSCGRILRKNSPDTILKSIQRLVEGTRLLVAFSPSVESFRANKPQFEAEWRAAGFVRGVIMGESFRLDEGEIPLEYYAKARLLFLADQQVLSDEDILGESGEHWGNSRQKEEAEPESLDPADLFSEIDDAELINQKNENGLEGDEENTETVDSDVVGSDGLEDEVSEREEKGINRLLTIDPDEETELKSYEKKLKEMKKSGGFPPLFFIVDRITIGKTSPERIRDSLETALAYGKTRCWIFCEGDIHLTDEAAAALAQNKNRETEEPNNMFGKRYEIDGSPWTLVGYSRQLRCEDCGIEYPDPEPKLFSFNSPLGACPFCEGFGNLMTLDLDMIVPNKNRSIREGAIAPWNSSSYRHKLRDLITIAPKLGVRVDVPFSELTREELNLVLNGNPELGYYGLNGFFLRLQKQKYKMYIRVFLSRWRSFRECPICHGTRLRSEALSVRIAGHNIHDFSSMRISQVLETIKGLQLLPWQREIGKMALSQVVNRLTYLNQVGLGYLTLERQMRLLSDGEQRRVSLTSVLGSSLVDMLYILDEPSIGLHPYDSKNLLKSILQLRDRGNTVIVVDHDETILESADHIVEIGPGAGQEGGRIVFEGTIDEMKASPDSLTGSYLSGRRQGGAISKRRILENGFIELTGARGYNLKNINVVFPLGVLCLVTGVSGAGKSSLVQETLYPAIRRQLGHRNCPPGLPFDQILGVDQIDDVMMIDQSPIGRSPRSNPVTYLKIFDDIRNVFAETPDAKANQYGAGYFSFNVDGGRCNACKGEGYLSINMQFMADMFVCCPQCHGRRYQKNILDILYRGKNIAEVLDLTVREAFGFFRGHPKIQQKLKRLIDVGLDYLRLGQPANTLSGGESQRLKLAVYLSNIRKGRCLFIMDEPTTGLHFADVVQLLDGFNALIETGHSLIVVEHNLQMIKAADYVIDLGPGAADDGGRIVAEGTPEELARNPDSKTGMFLAKILK